MLLASEGDGKKTHYAFEAGGMAWHLMAYQGTINIVMTRPTTLNDMLPTA